MQKLLVVVLFSLLWVMACKSSSSGPETGIGPDSVAVADTLPDTLAIAESLTGFFAWYEKNGDSLGYPSFVDTSGPHLTLNRQGLDIYLGKLRSSGWVSEELLDQERRFYEICEKEWAKEAKDEIPTGLNADRFYCAQDFIAPYSTGKVISNPANGRAMATLRLTGSMGESSDFTYEMKKENGKWLLARLHCDAFGIEE